MGFGEGGESGERLDGSGFVVGEHDGDEAGFGAEGAGEGFGLDDAVRVAGEEGDFDALFAEGLCGMEDGVVLDGGGDEVLARLDSAEEGEVVGFCASGGEDDLLGLRVEEAGYGGAGVVDGGAGSLAGLVDGGGVAEVLKVPGAHGLEDLGEERGGGVGVEVDAGRELAHG